MRLCKCDLFRLGYRRSENNVILAHLSRVTGKGVSEISLHIPYALCKLKFYVKLRDAGEESAHAHALARFHSATDAHQLDIDIRLWAFRCVKSVINLRLLTELFDIFVYNSVYYLVKKYLPTRKVCVNKTIVFKIWQYLKSNGHNFSKRHEMQDMRYRKFQKIVPYSKHAFYG